MAKQTFAADIRKHADLTKKQMRRVAIDSFQDVMELCQTSARGITAGGTRIEGRIPVVSSDLINSLVSSLSGGASSSGAQSYVVALSGLNLGDQAQFAWTMEYALRVEAGFTGTDEAGREYQQEGWHFVSKNAARFPEIVDANVKKLAR